MSLVIGLDVGGSTSRAHVADLQGHPVRHAKGEGGNPFAHGEAAVAAIGATVREALTGLDPAAVTASVMGLAGGVGAHADAFTRLWAALGLPAPRMVSDIELAFASGTNQQAGSVLVSGTGAAACHLEGGRIVRTADGHGWLLGDLGSGVWLGREAVRLTLSMLDRGLHNPPGLAHAVLLRLLGEVPAAREAIERVIATIHEAPVRELAALAPLALGDREIVAAAAAHLITTLGVVRDPGDASPLVLGGGLLTGGPLAAAVQDLAAGMWPQAPITHAGDGAAAAARLAIRDIHERVVS